MATMVSFHAHPDDESVLCGGSLALASRAGHRVVLVCATDGAGGEYPDDALGTGETLADVRRRELDDAARVLGISRTVRLGYADSGMRNTPANLAIGSFWTADRELAAARLAEILVEESAEVLTIYDSHGTYDHPDHVQVHRVGIRAAELAQTPYVFEATLNRDRLAHMRSDNSDPAVTSRDDVDGTEDGNVGLSEVDLTTAIPVGHVLDLKRAAIAAHASQYPEGSFFRAMNQATFEIGFGIEWYRQRPTHVQRARSTDLFTDDR
jgi:LmbE family N-acetylglucosaminyl deacetylase